MNTSNRSSGFAILAIIGAILLSSFTISDQSSANTKYASTEVYKELLIQVTGINAKNFTDVRDAIESRGGVVYKGYCESTHVLMYLVDRDMHPDNSFLNKLSLMSLTFEIKEGTIAQVSTDCGIDVQSPPNLNQHTETE